MDRRYLILVFSLITFSSWSQITNQRLYDTVPNMVEHYHKRLALFKSEKVQPGKIFFLGNSITEGGEWHQLTDNQERINRGIGGDVTYGVLNRLDEVIQRLPKKLFIMIGINDIGKDFPHAVIADNYKKIIKNVKRDSPATKIYVQSLLPINSLYPNFPQHYDKADHILIVNKLLRELAISEDVYFVNLYPLFLDKQNMLNATLTYDGLHLNEQGYKLWLTFLKENKYL